MDESPNKFSQFREGVKKVILETYVATSKEVELILEQELDTLQDIFEDGTVVEAPTVIAVMNDLEDK